MNQIRQFSFKEFWLCALLSTFVFFAFAPLYRDDSILHDTMDIIGALLIAIGAIGRFFSKFYFYRDQISTHGPYSIVRHPKCLMAYIAMIGLSIISARIQLMIFLPIMAGIIFTYIINRQENLMILIYGDEFREYQKKVPRVIPNFSKYEKGTPRRLDKNELLMATLELLFWFGIGLLLEGLEVFGL